MANDRMYIDLTPWVLPEKEVPPLCTKNHVLVMLMICRDGSEDGLSFAFRFTDATISLPNQGTIVDFNICIVYIVISGAWTRLKWRHTGVRHMSDTCLTRTRVGTHATWRAILFFLINFAGYGQTLPDAALSFINAVLFSFFSSFPMGKASICFEKDLNWHLDYSAKMELCITIFSRER